MIQFNKLNKGANMNQYLIYNNKNKYENYKKEFSNLTDARHWIINHLDLSNEWNIKPIKKVHHTEYKKNYKKYILSTIETGLNDEPLKTDDEKIKYIFDRFYSEYGFMINRVGKYKAMSEWLSGLALDIEYYNYKIVKLAKDMGSLDTDSNYKAEQKIINNYFDFMANIILGFEPKEVK
tara:strand:+ start:267 stop:803 length:537 start_codon:yes stop_codon:yes gene_type:complete